MTNFKVGDRVRVIRVGSAPQECLNELGVITARGQNPENEVQFYKVICENKEWNFEDKELELVENKFDNLEVGDILIDDDEDERTVLGICGKIIFVTDGLDDRGDADDDFYTTKELERMNWKIKQPEEEVTELTIDEIAEKFGRKPEQIKIKK